MLVAPRCAVLALLLFLPSAIVLAQSAAGDIQGTVVNESGAVLPGATVTIINTAAGAMRELITDGDGRFVAPGLPVGPYEVTASLQGFASRRQSDARVQVGQTLTLRLELGIAPAPETIALAGTLSVLEPTRSHVSSPVNATTLANLPSNGRVFIDFVPLTPGVTRNLLTGEISVTGQRETLNRVVVDGTDTSNTFFGRVLSRTGSGGGLYQFSLDAVQELQVNTNAYPAEYGRAGGAIINVVTRSGTNKLAGSVFEFYQDESLTAEPKANEPFRRPSPPKSLDEAHQFGGAVGGPIVQDRHFFFGNYDGLRNTEPNLVFPATTGRLIRFSPEDIAGWNKLQPFVQSWDRTENQDLFLVKTDHQLTGTHRLMLRYNQRNFTGRGLEEDGPRTPLQSISTSKIETRAFSVTLGSAIRSSLFNEARFHYARDRQAREPNSDAPHAEIRHSRILMLRIGRNVFSPREMTTDRLQFADTVTWVRRAHKLKAGADIRFDQALDVSLGNFAGSYVFNTLGAFNHGVPNGPGDTFTQAFAGPGTSGPETRPDINEYSAFVQDEWGLTDALTLNAGLRYDVQKFAQPPVRNPDPQLAAAGIDTSRLNTDTNNWGPRIGVAWAPVGRRVVVRGGYGLFYGRTPAAVVATAHANNGINVQTITLRGDRGDPVPTYPNRLPSMPQGVGSVRPTIFVFEPGYENARVQQASAGVEWEWMPHSSVAVNYLFAKGDQLPRSTDANVGAATPVTLVLTENGIPRSTIVHYQFAPGPFTNFNRVISFQSTAQSLYNGITIEMKRRFAQNYQYRVAYTLGNVKDTVPDATALIPDTLDDRKFASNPANFKADRAPGNNDHRHRFVGTVVYSTDAFADRFDGFLESLLEGWMLSAIYTAQSGQLYSLYVDSDINRDINRFNDLAPDTTRNEFRLRAFISLDPRVARTLEFGDRVRLTAIWEAFNLLNRGNYNAVSDTRYVSAGLMQLEPGPAIEQLKSQTNPRMMQLAVRVSF